MTKHRFVTRILLTLLVGLVTLVATGQTKTLPRNIPKTLATIDSVLADTTLLKNKVTYVDFWASWCPPCRVSFPWLEGLEAQYQGSGLQVVAISVDKDPKAANAFLKKMNAQFRVVYDSTGSLSELFDLHGIPSSFIYDRNGILRSAHQGFQARDTLALDSLVTSLLAEEQKK